MYPFKKIFSRPESSESNPAPNSIKGETVPLTVTFPFEGFIIPDIILSNVLFPEPLSPIIPITSPLKISKFISLKALNFSNFKLFFKKLIKNSFKENIRSFVTLNSIEIFSKTIIFSLSFSNFFFTSKSKSSDTILRFSFFSSSFSVSLSKKLFLENIFF